MNSLYRALTLPVRFLASNASLTSIVPRRAFHMTRSSPVRVKKGFRKRSPSDDYRSVNKNPLDIIFSRQNPDKPKSFLTNKTTNMASPVLTNEFEVRGRTSVRKPKIRESVSLNKQPVKKKTFSIPRRPKSERPGFNRNRNKSDKREDAVGILSLAKSQMMALKSISNLDIYSDGHSETMNQRGAIECALNSPQKTKSEIILTKTSNLPWTFLGSDIPLPGLVPFDRQLYEAPRILSLRSSSITLSDNPSTSLNCTPSVLLSEIALLDFYVHRKSAVF